MTKRPLSGEEEAAFVDLLQKGDQSAYDRLYRNYGPALRGIVFRMLRDKDDSEDMFQEVFTKIFTQISKYDKSKGRLFTWMANLTRNLVIDKLRSADYKNHSAQNFVRNKSVTVVDSQSSTSINTDVIGLKGILNKLSDEHKQIILKVYYSGYTQLELAEEMDIPLGTLKTKLRKAIGQLRMFFDKE